MSNGFGGLEVYFSYSPADNIFARLNTDIGGIKAYGDAKFGFGNISVVIGSVEDGDSTWIVCQTLINNTIVDQADYSMYCPMISVFNLRVFFGDKYLAIYCNDKMVYTYAFSFANYPIPVTASLKSIGDDIIFSNVRNVELFDRREAVFVDYEATSESAIQSIIQQRPILIYADIDRILSFTYNAIKDIVNGHNISDYTDGQRDNSQMSSDGLVYYADVSVSISEATAEEVGLVTRLYRLSDLDTGATQAASVYQEKALEKRDTINIIMRLDPRIEVTDNMLVDYVLTGTQRHLLDDIIIEDLQIDLQDGRYSLRITARRNK